MFFRKILLWIVLIAYFISGTDGVTFTEFKEIILVLIELSLCYGIVVFLTLAMVELYTFNAKEVDDYEEDYNDEEEI